MTTKEENTTLAHLYERNEVIQDRIEYNEAEADRAKKAFEFHLSKLAAYLTEQAAIERAIRGCEKT